MALFLLPPSAGSGKELKGAAVKVEKGLFR